MSKYSNIPILILLIWLFMMLFIFRICMVNIDMSFSDVRWKNVFDNVVYSVTPFIKKNKKDASEKSYELINMAHSTDTKPYVFDPNFQEILYYKADKLESDVASLLAQPNEESIKKEVKQPVKEEVKKPVKQEVKPTHKKEESLKKEDKVTVAVSYMLQCGSFKDKEKAEQVVDKIKNVGISSYVKEASGNSGIMYRVMVGPFNNENDNNKAKSTIEAAPISMPCYGFKYKDKTVSVNN